MIRCQPSNKCYPYMHRRITQTLTSRVAADSTVESAIDGSSASHIAGWRKFLLSAGSKLGDRHYSAET